MRRRLSLEDVIRQPAPGLDHPTAAAFAPGGGAVVYLQSADGTLVQSLWWHDLGSGDRRVLAGPTAATDAETALTHEEQLRRERRRTSELGVTEFAWSTDVTSRALLVPRAGEALVAVLGEGVPQLAPLPGVAGTSCTVLSPDGSLLAFVRDGDLWVAPVGPLAAGPVRRLTDDAEPGVTNGLAEYVAAEELGRFDGLWWAADGGAIAYAHVDERDVPPFLIAHLGAEQPRHEEHRYPFAGGPNARVSLHVAVVGGGQPRPVDLPLAPGDYLARVVARPQGGWWAAVMPRAQRALAWWSVAPDGSAAPGWTEEGAPWMNLDDDTRVLSDGRILRSTEVTGFRHLELRLPDGTPDRRLTDGTWMITAVVHVDEARQEVLFLGTRDGATQRHLYAVPLGAPEPVADPPRLTTEPGWHSVVFSRDGEAWLDSWSSLEQAPTVVVRERDGPARATLHQPSSTPGEIGVAPPQLMELLAADGATPLHAALYLPEPSAGDPPPCVVWVYGGPHAQYVRDSWEVTVAMLRQYLASAGAAVLVVDNRGSANRGIAFEAPLAGQLGREEVADQAAAVRQLAARGQIDATRVGVTGGSYGGFMTLMCMAREPSLFRVGAAISPVTDWDGYDTAYTERYLGMPDANPDGYRASAATTYVGAIVGELLIVHGALDENVHLRHSVRLLTALQAAGTNAAFVLLGDQRHRMRGHQALHARDRATAAHLLRGLGLALPEDLGNDGAPIPPPSP